VPRIARRFLGTSAACYHVLNRIGPVTRWVAGIGALVMESRQPDGGLGIEWRGDAVVARFTREVVLSGE
jgi:hypothetical protein